MKNGMKSVVWIMLLGCAASSFGEKYTKDEIVAKINGFSRMQNAGTGLLIGGIALDFIGPVLLVTGIQKMVDDEDWDSDSNDPPDGYWSMYSGVYCTTFGIAMTVAGGVLLKIGKNKRHEYERRLERFSVQITPQSASLTYDF